MAGVKCSCFSVCCVYLRIVEIDIGMPPGISEADNGVTGMPKKNRKSKAMTIQKLPTPNAHLSGKQGRIRT